jgi:hypothetical protein
VAAYLNAYPDVRSAGQEPLRHYVKHGRSEGRPTFGHGRAYHPGDKPRTTEHQDISTAEWRPSQEIYHRVRASLDLASVA